MAETKRYYWLKLPKDFFEDRAIKKLRTIAGGDTYTIIYLKMLLRSLEDNGKFIYEGIEENIVEEIALDIDEKEDDVQVAVTYLIQKGLMICTETEAELTRVHEMIGSETDKAKMMRKLRNQQKDSNNVTNLLPHVTNCYTEKDIDIEIDKKKDKKEKKKTDAEIIDSILESIVDDDLKNALSKFVDARKKMKKPLTGYAFELAYKKLQDLSPNISEQIEIVDQAIMSGWQSFYPLKKNNNQKNGYYVKPLPDYMKKVSNNPFLDMLEEEKEQ